MTEPATRYVVVLENNQVQGFITWQIDVEEEDIIIYWFIPQRSSAHEFDVSELMVATNYNFHHKYRDLV